MGDTNGACLYSLWLSIPASVFVARNVVSFLNTAQRRWKLHDIGYLNLATFHMRSKRQQILADHPFGHMNW